MPFAEEVLHGNKDALIDRIKNDLVEDKEDDEKSDGEEEDMEAEDEGGRR